MDATTDEPLPKLVYDYSAAAYWFAERRCHDELGPGQAKQGDITKWSFEMVRGVRPDVRVFSRLLIQYPLAGDDDPGQVRPDNFVTVHPEPVETGESFDLPFQPVGPFLVAEYRVEGDPRRDNTRKYEEELKVPYYLLFYPDGEELTLFRLGAKGYAAVPPNEAGRVAVPELELEAGLLGGWVRFWFRGELLPLPGDLLVERDAAREQRDAERAAREAAEQRATAAEAELAKLREELARAKTDRP